MKPEKVLTTGQLLQWFEQNFDIVYDFWYYNKGKNSERLHFIEWKYKRLKKNEELMQTIPSLEQFIRCKDGKPMDLPKKEDYTDIEMKKGKLGLDTIEYRQTLEKVLFEGWKINNPESDGYYLAYKNEINKAFWNSKDYEFELQIGSGFNQMATIEDLCREIKLIPTDNFWNKIGL